MAYRPSHRCGILACLFLCLSTASAGVLSESVNGTNVDWIWPSDNSTIPTYNRNDLVNVSWTTTTTMEPELLTICGQAGQPPGGGDSNGWVQSNAYHIIDIHLFTGSDWPYTCYFDFKDVNGIQLNTPSASFVVSGNLSDRPVLHAENHQNFTIDTASAPASSASASGSTPTSLASSSSSSSSSHTPARASTGVSPGVVAGIVIAVAVAISLIAAAIAFVCIRNARNRKRSKSEATPLWGAQNAYPAPHGTGAARQGMLEKDGLTHTPEVEGAFVGELEGGRPQESELRR